MLVTTIGQLRERIPDCRFIVLGYYPRRDRELCSDPLIEFYDYRPFNLLFKVFPLAVLAWLLGRFRIRLPDALIGKGLGAIRSADMMCDLGGITFCDGREIFLPYNVLSVLPAILLDVPVVKLSQAMGPFNNRLNRLLARWILGRCERSFARGEQTATHLNELAIPADGIGTAADVAFSWKREFTLTSENEPDIRQLERQLSSGEFASTVAIVPSSLLMGKSPGYIDAMAGLVANLVESGHRVLLLPNATRQQSGKPRNNDLVAIKEVLRVIRRQSPEKMDRVVAATFDINTAGIRQLLGQCGLVVTSRFHAMVAALASGIPTVVVGWSHKYGEVMQQFGCEAYGVDHQHRDDLLSIVQEALQKRELLARQINKALPPVLRSSQQQFEYVASMLGMPANHEQPDTAEQSEDSVVDSQPTFASAEQTKFVDSPQAASF